MEMALGGIGGRVAFGLTLDDRRRGGLGKLLLAGTAGLLALTGAAGSMTPPAHGAGAGPVPVIVIATAGAETAAERATLAVGGHVGRSLGIIHGFAATVPSGSVRSLARSASVASISPDARGHVLDCGSPCYSPVPDTGSAYNTAHITGAADAWDAGSTGQGIGVALIDTGIVPVDGLTTPGRIFNGPDLSFESQSPNLAGRDTYGHGTFMAGLIAGRDSAVGKQTKKYSSDTSDFLGTAPDANLLSVKVADAHGVADVSQVIAAIDWVVQHRNDNGMNIRVINLSYGTDSPQSYLVDPLAYAAETAWHAGLVVVSAAGNAGSYGTTLLDPAVDPYLIAVGAADTGGTITTADDSVASFSSVGNPGRTPDLVAPGVHLQSLRNPGSYIDATYGGTGDINSRFFRGSGTSQATALTSGAAALLLSARPGLTPDQVKGILRSSATPLAGGPAAAGAGELNVTAALSTPAPATGQTWTPARGSGTLERARGTGHVQIGGSVLSGEQDIFGQHFDSAGMAALEGGQASWSGGVWNGSTWTGSTWTGSTWTGSTWTGSTWTGSTWTGSTWTGSTWTGSTWTGSTWTGAAWF